MGGLEPHACNTWQHTHGVLYIAGWVAVYRGSLFPHTAECPATVHRSPCCIVSGAGHPRPTRCEVRAYSALMLSRRTVCTARVCGPAGPAAQR